MLRKYRLADPGEVTTAVLRRETVSVATIKRAIERSPVLVPKGTTATQVAESIAQGIASDSRTRFSSSAAYEVAPWEFSAFAPFRNARTDSAPLPLDILEDDIKKYFVRLVGECVAEGDWGGETNDLIARAVVNGHECATAFFLKGRSVKRPLEMRDCGKRGDQIDRLFTAPADIFVIQHVHQIRESVRTSARNHVERLRQRGSYAQVCFLDGSDLARILCGLGVINH